MIHSLSSRLVHEIEDPVLALIFFYLLPFLYKTASRMILSFNPKYLFSLLH